MLFGSFFLFQLVLRQDFPFKTRAVQNIEICNTEPNKKISNFTPYGGFSFAGNYGNDGGSIRNPEQNCGEKKKTFCHPSFASTAGRDSLKWKRGRSLTDSCDSGLRKDQVHAKWSPLPPRFSGPQLRRLLVRRCIGRVGSVGESLTGFLPAAGSAPHVAVFHPVDLTALLPLAAHFSTGEVKN